MSSSPSISKAATAAACVGLGVAAAAVAIYRARQQRLYDGAWHHVGVVTDVLVYGIKSGHAAHVERARATNSGLVVGELVDRSFVVIMSKGEGTTHVNNGMAPMLTTVSCDVTDQIVTLATVTKSCEPITFDLKEVLAKERQKITVRGEALKGYDCGEAIAKWISELIYGDKAEDNRPSIRLMFAGTAEELDRPATQPPFFNYTEYKPEDKQVFHDKSAFLVTTVASHTTLSSHLPSPLPWEQMRPNVVVDGPGAYEEDEWSHVRIGGRTVLRTHKPRDACVRINVDPNTGQRRTDVLDALKSHRTMKLPENLKEHWSKKAFFGIAMALDEPGEIRVGDPVEVIRKKCAWFL